MRNEICKKLTAVAALLLVVPFAAPASAEGAPLEDVRCLQLLEAARETMTSAPGHPEPELQAERGRKAYKEAFESCGDPRARSLEVGARVAVERGRYLHLYGNDPGEATAVFEDALEWTAQKGGLNHPVRIELLEGLAAAIHAEAALRGDRGAMERARQRALDIYREALAVREAAHGRDSLEAAEGLLLVAHAHLENQPVLAEGYARRALETAKANVGLVHPVVWQALVALEQALRQQGRADEVRDVQALLDEIHGKLDERGEPPH